MNEQNKTPQTLNISLNLPTPPRGVKTPTGALDAHNEVVAPAGQETPLEGLQEALPTPRWGWGAIISAAVLTVISQFIIAGIFILRVVMSNPSGVLDMQGNLDEITKTLTENPLLLILSQVAMYISWLLVIFFVSLFRTPYFKGKFIKAMSFNFGLTFKAKELFLGVGLGAIMWLLSNGLLTLFQADLPEELGEASNTNIYETLPMLEFIIMGFLFGSFLTPILEELLFRGLILRGTINSIERRYQKGTYSPLESLWHALHNHKWAISITISSIIFGFAHYSPAGEGIFAFFPVVVTGLVGAVLGYTVYKTGRIWAAIGGHIVFNSISFILIAFVR